MANPADSAAIARSQLATIWHPAAVARAWTLAHTGCGIDWIVRIISVQTSKTRWASSKDAPAMSPKLCPAENTGPVAAMTTPERIGLAGAPQRRRELEHHVERQGVALLGPIERDRDDRALSLDPHVTVRLGHRSAFRRLQRDRGVLAQRRRRVARRCGRRRSSGSSRPTGPAGWRATRSACPCRRSCPRTWRRRRDAWKSSAYETSTEYVPSTTTASRHWYVTSNVIPSTRDATGDGPRVADRDGRRRETQRHHRDRVEDQ